MASGGNTALPMTPMSVEDIVKAASEDFYDPQYKLQQWLRTASLMRKHAAIYESEGNIQMAYFLLFRHANLILNHLIRHPDSKDARIKPVLLEAKADVVRDLARLENLKPKINQRYVEHVRRRQKATLDRAVAQTTAPTTSGPKTAGIDAHADPGLAVYLAMQEIARRANAYEQRASANFNGPPGRPSRNVDGPGPSSMRKQYPEARSLATFHYPVVAPRAQYEGASADLHELNAAPQLPPKTRLNREVAPALPQKVPVTQQDSSQAASVSAIPAAKDLGHQINHAATLESGAPLRCVLLPSQLRREFLKVAQSNTARNLETCGILCGTLVSNAFFITKLVIPEQTATSDTCEMINEEALHAYVDSFSGGQELMVIGWIHTHPSQTCFLSSRDLHTHVWYQVSLQESIAIVCAPSQPAPDDYGIFRLTDPSGLQVVSKCSRPGIFHPHDNVAGGIYTDAGRPKGHVLEYSNLPWEVVDLRPG